MLIRGTTAIIAASVIAGTATADSIDISFAGLSQNRGTDVANQLNMNVARVDGTNAFVDFTFTNTVGVVSSLTDVFFSDGPPRSLFTSFIVSQSGADFTWDWFSNGEFDGGDDVGFNVTSSFMADDSSLSNGLDHSADQLVVRGIFRWGVGFDDLIERIERGVFRVGLHVKGIDGTTNGSFLSTSGGTPAAIPLPSAATLGLAGMAGLAVRRRR
jgi:hypothetical protein